MSNMHSAEEIEQKGVRELNREYGNPLREIDAQLVQSTFLSAQRVFGLDSAEAVAVENVINALLANTRFASELATYTDTCYAARVSYVQKYEEGRGSEMENSQEFRANRRAIEIYAGNARVDSRDLKDFLKLYEGEVARLCNENIASPTETQRHPVR